MPVSFVKIILHSALIILTGWLFRLVSSFTTWIEKYNWVEYFTTIQRNLSTPNWKYEWHSVISGRALEKLIVAQVVKEFPIFYGT
jgi:hypothetical protein